MLASTYRALSRCLDSFDVLLVIADVLDELRVGKELEPQGFAGPCPGEGLRIVDRDPQLQRAEVRTSESFREVKGLASEQSRTCAEQDAVVQPFRLDDEFVPLHLPIE